MARSPHPKKEVEDAIGRSEGQGWRVEVGGSLGADLLPVQR